MKRGKDEEKTMGPMFPRLHVNDTDKGGPRAPPRNKMALYEQFSIPSQRFNSAPMPQKPNSTNSLVPMGSSAQGNGDGRKMLFPCHPPPLTPSHLDERLHAPQSDTVSLNTPEMRAKIGDGDDFMVPIFFHPGMHESQSKSEHKSRDMETPTPLSPFPFFYSMKRQNATDKDQKRSTSGLSLTQRLICQDEESPKECVSGGFSVKSATNLPSGGQIDGSQEQANAPSEPQHQVHPGASFSSLRDNETFLQQEYRAKLQPDGIGCGDGSPHGSARDEERGNASKLRGDSQLGICKSNSNEPENGNEHHGEKRYGSPQARYVDRSDDVSETSMVDSASGLDISPDDIVGILGQKLFWKARRAIVNQQKVFAVQVFELHRLIKVQRLFAGSPHLLLEDNAYSGKPSLEGSPAKKLPSEYIVKSPQPVKGKFDSDKPNHNLECSAENAVGKTSLPSKKISSLPSNYEPYLAFPPPSPVTEAQMGPWCFPQPHGHQWLVPVMSPSEGLIYKPYPGPGFMGPVYGGCGPTGPPPSTGNFFNPPYGVPSSNHHYQGTEVIPSAPPVSHGYFPPYNMPVFNLPTSGSAIKQLTLFDQPCSNDQTGQLSRGRTGLDLPHQGSHNVPSHSELQGSTASSPGDRRAKSAEGRVGRPSFAVAPVVTEEAPHHHDSEQPAQVIKVVPHNRRSATESAARIFQSIQEERKQYDSM